MRFLNVRDLLYAAALWSGPRARAWLWGCAVTVAVVGSGPAGLAAAQQLTRAGHTVAVFERRHTIACEGSVQPSAAAKASPSASASSNVRQRDVAYPLCMIARLK